MEAIFKAKIHVTILNCGISRSRYSALADTPHKLPVVASSLTIGKDTIQ
jgi:hypothetical protein